MILSTSQPVTVTENKLLSLSMSIRSSKLRTCRDFKTNLTILRKINTHPTSKNLWAKVSREVINGLTKLRVAILRSEFHLQGSKMPKRCCTPKEEQLITNPIFKPCIDLLMETSLLENRKTEIITGSSTLMTIVLALERRKS